MTAAPPEPGGAGPPEPTEPGPTPRGRDGDAWRRSGSDDGDGLALAQLDAESVKRLVRIAWSSFVGFALIYVFCVTIPIDAFHGIWIACAWVLLVWIVMLIIMWETSRGWDWRARPMSALLYATPHTVTWSFRVSLWFTGACYICLVVAGTVLFSVCFDQDVISAGRGACSGSAEIAWRVVVWSSGCCLFATYCFFAHLCWIFLAAKRSSRWCERCECDPCECEDVEKAGGTGASGPNKLGYVYWCCFLTAMVTWLAFSIVSRVQCNGPRTGGIIGMTKRLTDGDFGTDPSDGDTDTEAAGDCGVTIDSIVTAFWQLYAIVIGCRLYLCGKGCKPGACCGCCCCTFEPNGLPKWARLQSRFLLMAALPMFCVLEPFEIVRAWGPENNQLVYATAACIPFMCVQFHTFYAFACLPAGIERFLCVRLAYLPCGIEVCWPLIYTAFLFSNDAYFDDPTTKKSASASGFLDYQRAGVRTEFGRDGVVFISSRETDTHVHLSVTEPDDQQECMLIIAFRGTGLKSLQNLCTDASFFRNRVTVTEDGLAFKHDGTSSTSWEGMAEGIAEGMTASVGCSRRPKVHGGFVAAYLSIRDELLDEYKRLMKSCGPPRPRVLCCGHSLGGALATLFTVEITSRGLCSPEDLWFVTFGSPRVGNYSFARLFGSMTIREQCWRMQNAGDFISSIPKFYKMFKHVGIQVELSPSYKRDGSYTALIDPSPLERSLLTARGSSLIKHRRRKYWPAMDGAIDTFCSDPKKVRDRHQMLSSPASEAEQLVSAQEVIETVMPRGEKSDHCCLNCIHEDADEDEEDEVDEDINVGKDVDVEIDQL